MTPPEGYARVPMRIAFDEAMAIVHDVAGAHRTEVERLATERCHGRVLAADIVAPMPLPPFANSAMDGYAFRHADLASTAGAGLALAGEQFAGGADTGPLAAGACVGITTGAPMPPGADTVAIVELARRDGDRVHLPADTRAGANVRAAGEDVRAGDTVLRAGDVLGPVQVALAAALGVATLPVARRPTVAVFTTGDELVAPGLPLGPGQIHDANRDLLAGLLRAEGLEPTLWPALPDDPRRIEVALRDACCAFDVVVTCGGVSAGGKDYVPAVLAGFGTPHFWKVRMKPGMPLLFGSLDQARLLGLPGNPVSVLATWLTLGRALVDGLQGRRVPRRTWQARLATPVRAGTRVEFVRGRLDSRADGTLWVHADAATGSHRLRAAAAADALLVVPDADALLEAGTVVEVLPL